jgi:sulfonate transport system permease protein
MTAAPHSVIREPFGPIRAAAGALRSTRRRSGSRKRPLYELALGPVLLLALWCIASAAGWLPSRVLSAPWTVVATAVELIENGKLPSHLATSAQRVLVGLAAGTLAGTILALLSGLSQVGEALIDGPVQIKRSLPTLALIPLFIVWLGIGEPMKLLTISLATMVPVYVHTHAGLRSIDARYVELAESLRLGRFEFIRKIALPGALPGFVLGIRFALTSAWLSLVVVEQINATSGVGYMISLARSYGQTEIIVVGLAVYALLGLSSDALVRWLEGRALSWRRTLAG